MALDPLKGEDVVPPREQPRNPPVAVDDEVRSGQELQGLSLAEHHLLRESVLCAEDEQPGKGKEDRGECDRADPDPRRFPQWTNFLRFRM